VLDIRYAPSALKTLTRLAQRRPEAKPYLPQALRIEHGAPSVEAAVEVSNGADRRPLACGLGDATCWPASMARILALRPSPRPYGPPRSFDEFVPGSRGGSPETGLLSQRS